MSQFVKLGDVAKVISGYAFKSASFSIDGTVPVIKIKNIKTGSASLDDADYVDIDFIKKIDNKFHIKSNDILISLTGSHMTQPNSVVGRVGKYPSGYPIALLNQRAGKIIPNERLVNQTYLYYVLLQDDIRHEIAQMAHGAASQANVSPSQIESVQIPLPEMDLQEKIASILSAYDDLIENNNRRITILEEMARSLYREWFVKFRFPGHEEIKMVDSELGQIPEGWEVKKLHEISYLTMGQSPKSEFYNEYKDGLPFFQGVADFGGRFPSNRIYCTKSTRFAAKGDILFSVRAPVGRLNFAHEDLAIGRGLAAIKSKDENQNFLFLQLKTIFYKDDIMGNGSIFNSVTKDDVQKIKILVPNADLVKIFENNVRVISKMLDNLHTKNRNLKTQRDMLLPKLISGKIKV